MNHSLASPSASVTRHRCPRVAAWLAPSMLLAFLALAGCGDSSKTPAGANGSATVATPSATVEETPWFVDRTPESGLKFVHDRGETHYWLPEMTGSGAAWIDYDNDGDQDLYLIQSGQNLGTDKTGGPGNALYRNRGDGTFEDVTEQAGVGDSHYGMGVTVGDYDQDGDLDLYTTNVGPNQLYRNRGDGTFEDVAQQAGVQHGGWSTASAFVDYDQDGDTDLVVINYIRWSPETEIDCRTGDNQQDYCSPVVYQAPARDTLYRNKGDGTFEDVSQEVGLNAAYGNGLGLVVCDFNADGRLDFYVANDGTPNQLWLQDEQGRFQDRALLLGCSVNRNGVAQAGMGVAAIDLQDDGDFDLFMTHLAKETNTLYINNGTYFADQSSEFKLATPSLNYTGFGLGFVDFDHDTRLDLFVANGRVGKYQEPIIPTDIYAEPNLLFRGDKDGTFSEVMPQGGTKPVLIENSRASAMADYDKDGDVDILLLNNGGRATLLANVAGAQGRWVRFRALDDRGRDPVGAQVGIRVGDQWRWRLVGRTHGYLSANEPEVHFGLGDATRVDEVRVVWPGQKKESFGGFDAGAVVELRQGSGQSQP